MLMSNRTIRALVVDDTALYRKIVGDVLAELPNVKLVGSAHNGAAALSKIKALKPDLVTLDIEMPEMNGIEVLEALKPHQSGIGVIMVSSLTRAGGDMTMRALALGAYDFITKPQGGSLVENKRIIREALSPLVSSLIARGKLQKHGPARPALPLAGRNGPMRPPVRHIASRRSEASQIVAIGISTGGPNALTTMMPKLPGNIGVPIVVVQHMPPVFTQSLAQSLNNKCAVTVKEAENGETLQANVVYIAPGGRQMKVVAGGNGYSRIIRITDDPPENNCRPSADYLFRSVAQLYVGRATGVIMTGMGSDGLLGLKRMKQSGAILIGQDEASCVVYGMPKAPAEAGILDVVAPLHRIAEEIVKTVKKSPQHTRSSTAARAATSKMAG